MQQQWISSKPRPGVSILDTAKAAAQWSDHTESRSSSRSSCYCLCARCDQTTVCLRVDKLSFLGLLIMHYSWQHRKLAESQLLQNTVFAAKTLQQPCGLQLLNSFRFVPCLRKCTTPRWHAELMYFMTFKCCLFCSCHILTHASTRAISACA